MTIAIYPGSFDPITNGHLDILKSGSEIFDKVIIAVSYNINKKGFLTVEERVDLIKKSISHLPNVEVDSFEGLTVEYAKKKGAIYVKEENKWTRRYAPQFRSGTSTSRLFAFRYQNTSGSIGIY